MKTQFLHIILSCCVISFLVACTAEFQDGNDIPNNVKAIELTVQTAKDLSSTTLANNEESGVDALNENKVKNIEVYFFNTDGSFHSKIEEKYIDPKNEVEKNKAFKLRISIPINKVVNYNGKTLQICVVANHTSTLPDKPSLQELREIIEETELNTPANPQDKFLMDGMVTTEINWGDTPLFNVSEPLYLQRAAAKIRLSVKSDLIEVNGDQYTPDELPEVRLVNYTNKTTLIQGGTPYKTKADEWKKTEDYIVMDETITLADGENYATTSIPFYTYENNWKDNSEKETYLLVKINLRDPEDTIKPYYYRIPVNYRLPVAGIDETELYQLKRNHLYNIKVNIETLGSEDETKPLEIESSIAIEPWIEEEIDGDIQGIHYLIVKETRPTMANTDTREVEYVSDLPIEIKINKVGFELYDEYARLVKVVWEGNDGKRKVTYTEGEVTKTETVDNPFDGAKITPDKDNKELIITHTVPTNFVPFEIDFTVTQVLPESEKDQTPLSQNVIATQYPGKYITGEKSPGFSGGTSVPAGADFRYHSFLGGAKNKENKYVANSVLYKITTLTSNGYELIGDPVYPEDEYGRTNRENEPNKLISPQFIIASQHGMTIGTPQYKSGRDIPAWVVASFKDGYGPFNKEPNILPYYHSKSDEGTLMNVVLDYKTIEARCAYYFEGEYGTDGNYMEYYVDKSTSDIKEPIKKHREVYKTFKYKGRWRMPTEAEIELIARLQSDNQCAIKYLLTGNAYFSALPGKTFAFDDKIVPQGGYWTSRADNYGGNVRCVFDTYKIKNHP